MTELDKTNKIKECLGQKYLGGKASLNDFKVFISECVKKDRNIMPNIDDYDDENNDENVKSKDPTISNNWKIDQICTDTDDDRYDEVCLVYDIQVYFDNAEYWGGYYLHYKDANGEVQEVDKTNIRQVATMYMPYYDTTYRINIFDTKDGYLLLGINEGD